MIRENPVESNGMNDLVLWLRGDASYRAAALYVSGCFLLILFLPRISNNLKILVLFIVAACALPLLRSAIRATGSYCGLFLGPLIVLCLWISVQTPLAASEPVVLFGPKEAVGLLVTFWMAGVIPGMVCRYSGWHVVRFAIAWSSVAIFIGTLLSYVAGIGERHQIDDNTFRAYFYFSDAVDVAVAFLVIWHAARGNRVLTLLSALSLFMMLGKLALGLLLLNVLVLLAIPERNLRVVGVRVALISVVAATLVSGGAGLRTAAEELWLEATRSGEESVDTNGSYAQRRQGPAVDAEVRACVDRALAAESFILRAECAAVSARAYPGPTVVNAGINTLARRSAGVVAALDIAFEHPWVGMGYHQSWRALDEMESGERNPFGLNDMFARPEKLWHRIGQIRNTWARSLAEFGVPGLVILILLGIGVMVIATRVLFRYLAEPGKVPIEASVASIWVIVYIVAAQTNPWLLPGSVATAWLGVQFGVMMAGIGAKRSVPRTAI